MSSTEIDIVFPDGKSTRTFVALPAAQRAPAVVLVPPIFGVTEPIKEFAHLIAAEGFVVAVPDPFARSIPGPLGYEGADRDRAQERYKGFDVEQGVVDLGAAMSQLARWDRVVGGVGVVGLCFGGRYAFLAASRLGAGAAVSYHGTFIEKHVDECARITGKVGLHFGGNDPQTPLPDIGLIRDAARACDNDAIETHIYAGAGHGFMQHDRPAYIKDIADLAFARGIATLRSGLGSGGKS